VLVWHEAEVSAAVGSKVGAMTGDIRDFVNCLEGTKGGGRAEGMTGELLLFQLVMETSVMAGMAES